MITFFRRIGLEIFVTITMKANDKEILAHSLSKKNNSINDITYFLLYAHKSHTYKT